ncbi:hypothetical protein C2R88_01865, partial [Helicobacter pylori]
MEVSCKNSTPVDAASQAIRSGWQRCEDSDHGGWKDKDLIHRVGNIFMHSSTLEHLYYYFVILGLCFFAFLDLIRHSFSILIVKSCRYSFLFLFFVFCFFPLFFSILFFSFSFLFFFVFFFFFSFFFFSFFFFFFFF